MVAMTCLPLTAATATRATAAVALTAILPTPGNDLLQPHAMIHNPCLHPTKMEKLVMRAVLSLVTHTSRKKAASVTPTFVCVHTVELELPRTAKMNLFVK
jgi:hypothetical protein